MSDIIIREIEERDLCDLKSLIVEAFGEGWNFARFDQHSDSFQALLEVYLSMFLESSTFGRVAIINNKVAGAVLCSSKGDVEKLRQLQKGRAPSTLMLLTATESERMDIVEHLSTSFRAIGQLLEHRVDTYDGSLEFIAVSKQAQGLKIGKMLWGEASAYFNARKTKSIYLIADSACNFGFYDYNGFSRVDAKKAIYNYSTGRKQFDIFVYEYRF